jgi:hypothetical protein
MMAPCKYARPGYCTFYKHTPVCDGDNECSYYSEKEDDEDEDENE